MPKNFVLRRETSIPTIVRGGKKKRQTKLELPKKKKEFQNKMKESYSK